MVCLTLDNGTFSGFDKQTEHDMYVQETRIFLWAAAFLLAGCASSLDGGTYGRDEARREMRIEFATVESVRPVQLEGARTHIGSLAGAALGGIAGSAIGSGSKESAAGAVIGGVAGGIAGNAIEEAITRKPGVEITVKLTNGEYRAVVQQDEGENFQPGEQVRLVSGSGATRIAR
jgi:outer membrane lipoprotein SlyB